MTAVDYSKQTALVTGASSGIGAEFARQLAERGSDVVLVARRLDRLEGLAAEIAANYGVRAEAISLDLGLPAAGQTLVEEVERRALDVTSLDNNAGFGSFGPFHEEDPKRLREMVGVDVASVVDVSRAFIGRLRAAGSGVLVNIASLAAYGPIPNEAVYAASKAFVLSFTEALWQESLGTGLRVIALSPGATRTEFNDVVGTEDATSGAPYFQTPREVVETGLRALDRRTPPPSVVSGRTNLLMANAGRLLSRRRAALVAGYMTRAAN